MHYNIDLSRDNERTNENVQADRETLCKRQDNTAAVLIETRVLKKRLCIEIKCLTKTCCFLD